MNIVYLGNFEPPHSTENHLAASFELAGHRVTRLQEGRVSPWAVAPNIEAEHADLFCWTQTYGLAESGGTIDERLRMVDEIRAAGVPSVGLHLDRWWGLEREEQVAREAFFRLDLVCTADGGNDDAWEASGVRHAWMPPGVFAPECVPGTYRPELASDVAFVGSWKGYHAESPHRRQLVLWLHRRYGDRFAVWPQGQALRGRDLADLYASVKVIVGDSCLVGMPGFRGAYISDRVPETLGRGGFLLHPHVKGVTDGTLFQDSQHLWCWDAGDWDRLGVEVDVALDDAPMRAMVAESGRRHVLAHHTYTVRVVQVLAELARRGLIDWEQAFPPSGDVGYALGRNEPEGDLPMGERVHYFDGLSYLGVQVDVLPQSDR